MITMTVYFIPKNSDSTSFNLWQFSSMPCFIVLIYLCLQCLIPSSSSPIHLLFSWRKFALCIQSLLCMLFLFGWPPCQRSDMILMEVSQLAYDMIHYISGLLGYFYVCEIYVNLIWYRYLFMLNKFCLSLSLSLIRTKANTCTVEWLSLSPNELNDINVYNINNALETKILSLHRC